MVKFKFMGTEICITEERDNYNTVKLQYENIAKECIDKFVKQYKENNKNLDDVINKAYDQGAGIILTVINSAVDSLVDQKFYTINNELFIEKYCKNAVKAWDDAYNDINDKYMDIVLDEKQKEEYRQYRKNSRGRWQGGGFGVQGAVKGAMQAGALNAVTGMAHGTFNMIGKISSNVKANKQKSKVFSDPSTIYILVDGLYSAIYNIHYSYIKFLEDNTNIKFGYVYSEDSKQAQVIFSNIKDRHIDSKEKVEIVKTLINQDPYEESVYRYAIDNFGDKNREISEIANYFGYDVNSYKYDIINKKSSTLTTNTEEETIKAKQILLEETKRLGIDSDINEIDKLDKKLNKFDIEARTVNGILFETREEAKLANTDKVKIELILNKVNLLIEKEIIEAKERILNLNLKTRIVDSYIKDLNKELNELDIKARTVDGILFETREEANLAKKEYLEIKEIIENTMDDRKSLTDSLAILEHMNLQSTLSHKYVHELEIKLKLILVKIIIDLVRKSRTVDGIEFQSMEEKRLAIKEKSILENWTKDYSTYSYQELDELKTKIDNNITTNIKDSYINKINKLKLNIEENERRLKRDKIRKIERKKNIKWTILSYIICLFLFFNFGWIVKFLVVCYVWGSIESICEQF